MYTAALEFLEEERDAWRPYEALADLDDAQLARLTDPAGPGLGWSGRELAGHMIGWMEVALAVARELAVSPTSAAKAAADRAWAERGDALNTELHAAWAELPLPEVRRRLREVPGELRGTLTVIPEARWLKDPDMLRFFTDETIDHEMDHLPVLEAVLAAARSA
jgi:hypothetical protein